MPGSDRRSGSARGASVDVDTGAASEAGSEPHIGVEPDTGGEPNIGGDQAPGTDEAVCRKQAMDLLARREHSRRELERKLAARRYTVGTVESALDGLERDGLLADERFAEIFIRTRAARGHGPRRIRRELAERGVDGACADELLEQAGEDWHALAARVRAKRFGKAAPREYAERARQVRFLEYRGFEREQIHAALDIAADSD